MSKASRQPQLSQGQVDAGHAVQAQIPIASIRIDGGTQMRAELDELTVADYAQTIREGGDFPAVIVFFDGSKHWLADGFHRLFAYQKAGAVEIPVDIRSGTKRDAILHSVSANSAHGLRRTNADKRKAVETLLADKEWSSWSDREIGRQCAVDHKTVGRMRDEHLGNSPDSRTVERNGTTYQQDTTNIGKVTPGTPAPATAKTMTLAQREEQKRQRDVEQAEFDREREEHRASLPAFVGERDARKANAGTDEQLPAGGQKHDGLTDADRIAELEEAVRTLEGENAGLKAETVKFSEMKAQYDKGGFAEVEAGYREQIRVLQIQVESESAEKISNLSSLKFWKKEARRLGWKPDVVKIDTKTGALKDA